MVSISIKEILIIGGIIGALIWMRMARESVEVGTDVFMRKLRGPSPGRSGFGWRGLVVAFVVGIVACCAFGYILLRLSTLFFGPGNG